MPFVSAAQRGYFNANRGKLERQGVDVDEWNHASQGLKLPEHAMKTPVKSKTVNLGRKGSFEEKPGALHEDLGIPLGQKIPEQRLQQAEHSPKPQVRRRAISAEGFKHMHHGGR
jgi:hypothetical protein